MGGCRIRKKKKCSDNNTVLVLCILNRPVSICCAPFPLRGEKGNQAVTSSAIPPSLLRLLRFPVDLASHLSLLWKTRRLNLSERTAQVSVLSRLDPITSYSFLVALVVCSTSPLKKRREKTVKRIAGKECTRKWRREAERGDWKEKVMGKKFAERTYGLFGSVPEVPDKSEMFTGK